jgi:hypothetical protein
MLLFYVNVHGGWNDKEKVWNKKDFLGMAIDIYAW